MSTTAQLLRTSPSLIADFKSRVAGHVDITDLGELHWLLGIEERREREAGRLFLSPTLLPRIHHPPLRLRRSEAALDPHGPERPGSRPRNPRRRRRTLRACAMCPITRPLAR